MTIDLHDILKRHQATLLADLEESRELFDNAEAKGDATESDWLKVIEKFLPRRYQCTPGFVLDSNGDRSEFIDIVIHDVHYCPLLFEKGGQTYIPAESVYAALEIKQDLSKEHIEYAAGKGESVRRLHRTSNTIVNMGGAENPRELFTILTGIVCMESTWSPPFGDAFDTVIAATAGDETRLDIGCALRHGAFDIDWNSGSPSVTRSEPDLSLMFFLLRLFGRLQAVGTVPAIDLVAYGRTLEA